MLADIARNVAARKVRSGCQMSRKNEKTRNRCTARLVSAFRWSRGLVQVQRHRRTLARQSRGEGHGIALGHSDAASIWKIIQVERSITSDIVLTLRAESAMGILPELDNSRISPACISDVKSAYSRAVDAAFRELPTSVVDQCRKAAVVFISRWMQGIQDREHPTEQDLGAWIKALRNHFGQGQRVALISALEIINKLHPRGKDNERLKMSLRTVDEGDASFAIHALAFVLREIQGNAHR